MKTCEVCGQRVEVYSSKEGTCSYIPVAEEENKKLRIALSNRELEKKSLADLQEVIEKLAEGY